MKELLFIAAFLAVMFLILTDTFNDTGKGH